MFAKILQKSGHFYRQASKTTDDIRECNVNIHGRQSEDRFFAAKPSSDSPSAYQGEGLFSFQVPIGLEKAILCIPCDAENAYRVSIDGGDLFFADNGSDFPLGTIEGAMKIEVVNYQSPKILLNVVDETGQPVMEYHAWIEYTKHGTPAKIKVDGDKIRVDITPERWYEIDWEFARSEITYGGILDITFKYKNFGTDETKINADSIIPDEEMRLHIIGKGFVLAEQVIPKMIEGEERELTVTLKK